MKGLVIKNTGSWYCVQTAEHKVVECKIKGTFRMKGIRTTNPVTVGDKVEFAINAEGFGLISKIEERKNYIIRKASNLSKQSHIIAANLDQVLLLVTIQFPEVSTLFIDRFLATAEAYSVPAGIVFNKTDLHTDAEREYMEQMIYLYEQVGYPCYRVSATEGIGMELLAEKLKHKVTLLSGYSGVGKSTFINVLIPEVKTKVGAISQAHNKGMHTTTFSEMYTLPYGGYIIDTPGVKGFGTIDLKKEEIGHFFPEIFRVSRACRFANCTHTHEPGCAVLQAIDRREISLSRYQSYLSIMQDDTEGKYR